jgi:polyribonucleotide nucleotidyltransferase
MEKRFYMPEFGYELVVGKFAGQADGAAWLQQGGTIVLATAVTAASTEFPGFLPLTIDYRELFSAAGKIPGGYYKREGKFSDKEILTSRLIDRTVRPLFPSNFFNQLQILATVYSVDKEHSPQTLALLATSLSLTLSKIPFLGPVGVVEIGRVNGQWVYNPLYSQSLQSDVKIIVAGTDEGICMVEGQALEISEAEFVQVMFEAHEIIKKQVAWQKSIAQELDIKKEPITEHFDWQAWFKKAESFLTDDAVKPLFSADKIKRGEAMAALKEAFFAHYKTETEDTRASTTMLQYVFDRALERKLTDYCFVMNKRVDLRNFDAVRNISIDVGLLPFNHGSALFTRGRTQALASVTLGGGQDEQRIEDIMGDSSESSFMLHYNFNPFSVGEVRPMRGPGRREVGHGYLAASAIKPMLPAQEKFPYTIRIVTDILESDGSSSMATVCSSTMALMNAGVPITKMVSGIAMGLLKDSNGRVQVLSDIAGIEDAFGLMDFKVAGTDTGITAIQMDIKYKGGLTREIFETALAQARAGRLHILHEMRKVMSAPNPQLSALVPHIVSFKVPTDKIGAIIGSGGKVIRDIIDKTGTTIDIEDDGTVKIFGHPGPKLDTAVGWVKVLGGMIDRGAIFTGRIKRLADFGIFVEIAPGLDGLVHISNLPRNRQNDFQKSMKVEDIVTVEVVDYDEQTGRIRLRLIESQNG